MSVLTTPKPEVKRDRFGRPYIIPEGGGKPKAYTRATTLAGTTEDTYALGKWLQRQAALGFVDRPDLILAVAAARDDRQRLDEICEAAIEASKANAAATVGTAVHALTEVIDRGGELPVVPAAYQADLDAYRAATANLRPVHIEQMVVLDDIEVAGTPDRIVEIPDGRHVVADIKTGKIDYGSQKIAIQLALYAHGRGYDVTTGARFDLPPVDQERAIVVHLPAGTGQAELHWIDIAAGWEAVDLAVRTRTWRKRRGLLTPCELAPDLAALIATAPSVEALERLYHANTGSWTAEHTAAAAARKAQLAGVAA